MLSITNWQFKWPPENNFVTQIPTGRNGISLYCLNIKDNVQSGKKRCQELVLLEQF